MKTAKWITIMVAVIILSSFALAGAQKRGGQGRWPAWSASYYHWNWNPATVETIKGEVMTKDLITPPQGKNWSPAVGLTLKKGDAYAAYVHLGPQWYIDRQGIDIEVGDQVEVTGSKILVEGNKVILVSIIKKGDRIWQLRDEKGFPFWSARRR